MLSRSTRFFLLGAAALTLGACASEPVMFASKPGVSQEQTLADAVACGAVERTFGPGVKLPDNASSFEKCMKDKGYTLEEA